MTSSSIIIPPRFEQKLAEDRTMRSMVDANIHPFETWYLSSGTTFFREYTNHGPAHVNGLLFAAAALITDETYDKLSAADVAVFILAALLHDVGMHLTDDGFSELIAPAAKRAIIGCMDDRPWCELWDEFLDEASHFDEKQLKQLLGEVRRVSRPAADSEKWNSVDRKIIGEFIRRHHPRLSHEVALFGAPGPGTLRLQQVDNLMLDLVGFIARSHGLPLRGCFDYLVSHFHLREFKRVHAIYLMVLLRLSDYLQIQSERAPKEALQVQSLRSTISAGEWKAHDAIVNITTLEQDPEVINVDARPRDIKTYLHLKRLFANIQGELDSSWAVLGEVYGRIQPMGLTLRRLRSSLEDEKKFAATVDYIPRPAALTVSARAPKLISLLVEPLYGARPEFAIRELLQNAVDAVRERDDYIQRRSPAFSDFSFHIDPVSGKEIDAVVLSIEQRVDGSHCVIVDDGGIGMTPDTVINYFLTAGASFRESEAWRKQHTAEGHSRILRSGRFGIGVLAAFLLGNTVKVRTRHLSAPPDGAIEFVLNPLEEVLELRKTTAPIGTRIEIELSKELYRDLKQDPDKWFWYVMDNPAVIYCIDGAPAHFSVEHNIFPARRGRVPGETLKGYRKEGWRRIQGGAYPVTDYAYNSGAPALSCNGMRVMDRWPRWRDEDAKVVSITAVAIATMFLPFVVPDISIQDPDALLPLGLRRLDLTRIDENIQDVVRKIRRNVAKDLASKWATKAPNGMSTENLDGDWMIGRGVYEFTDYKYQIFMYSWCALHAGVTLLLPTLLRKSGVRRVFFVDRSGWNLIPPEQRRIEPDEAVIAYTIDSGKAIEIFREFILENNAIRDFVDVAGCAILLPGLPSAPEEGEDNNRIPYYFKSNLHEEDHYRFIYGLDRFAAGEKWQVWKNCDGEVCQRLVQWAELLAQYSNPLQMAGAWILSDSPGSPSGWRDKDIANYFESAFKGPAIHWHAK